MSTIAAWVAESRQAGFAVRMIARGLGLTVGEVHAACLCRDRQNCQGPGCRIGAA